MCKDFLKELIDLNETTIILYENSSEFDMEYFIEEHNKIMKKYYGYNNF